VHDTRSLRPLHAVPGDARRSTSRSTPSQSGCTSPAGSGTLRTYRLGDARLLRTRRVTIGSYNVCALDGRVVTPSLDDGRLTLLDSRGLRSAHLAPHAHDACIVIGG
jgi:hypothetical protein